MNDAFDIEELLKDNLLNKSKEPPIGLFQEIERRLIRRKKRRRLFWILFWLGLGIGTYFTGVYVTTMFNSECDCRTFESDERGIKKTKYFIDPVLQATRNSTIIDIENKAHEKDVNLVEVAQKGGNHTSFIENRTLGKSDSHISGKRNIEVAQMNGLPLSESDMPNKAMVELEPAKKSTTIGSSEGENHSKKDTEALGQTIGQIKHSGSLVASIVESTGELPLTNTSQQIIPEREKFPQDKTTITAETKDKYRKYGLVAYAGPSFFDMAVFKPYLSSGSLSNRPFKSSGYELGIGGLKMMNERWQVNLSIAYNRKRSRFLYNLLVSEEDYFNYYDNGVLISVEQLDQEESCNCFVANEVQLEYEVNTVNLSFGMSYQLTEFKKFSIHGNFNLSTNVFTQFKNNSSSVVNFLSKKTEKFNSLGLKPGFTIGYGLTKNTRLTLSPNYTYLFTRTESSFYARPLQEITVSLGMTFLL